jgi:hypothetical protein
MQLTNLLRFDYWLDPSVTDHPAGRAMWFVVATGLLCCALAAMLRHRGYLSRNAAVAWFAAGALVGVVGIGRLFAIPIVGWRIGWLIAAAIAAIPVAHRLARHIGDDGLVTDCVHAMAFAPRRNDRGDWHASTAFAWLAYNLICATVVVANLSLPLWVAPWAIAFVLAPLAVAFVVCAARRQHLPLRALSAMAPLTIAYLTALIGLTGLRIPGVLNGVLSLPLASIVMTAYAFVVAGRWALDSVTDARSGDRLFVKAGAALLVVVALSWSAWAALSLRTQGVTGSDPYAYAQMGVDLVTRGTVYHPFPLVEVTYDLGIDSYPVIQVGYRIPAEASRQSATVWPPGYAVFTALAYLIGGEPGLYVITPLAALVSLAVVAWFAFCIVSPPIFEARDGTRDGASRPRSVHERAHARTDARSTAMAVSALTVMLTATSYQQIEWQMIPMADIAAQLFSLLALGLAFAARGSAVRALLSGLALGIAFDIRYTQVLMAPAIALALASDDCAQPSAHNPRVYRRLTQVALCAGAALVAAVPVLAYHQVAFGSPLVTGSEELGNFSLARLPETLWRTLGELNGYREFGLLTPLIFIGMIALWQVNRRALAVLATYVLILFGFHAFYAYLRLRDLLFLFPVLYLLAALGAVAFWRWTTDKAGRPWVRHFLSISLICAVSYIFVLRAMETLAMPVTRGFNAFGYLVREQRESFDRLRALTPDGAVVGTSLNGGAIGLHSGRLAFRPASWSAGELGAFVDRLQRVGAPVYVLADGDELEVPLATLRERYRLVEVGRLDVPYYDAIGGGSSNRSVPLYAVRT